MTEKKKESSLSLSAKAKKFDVSLSTLKKVYKRGVAAWNSGHRPGTTPQQWGHARVNSFLRKGKTYHTADKDLREDAEQLNELKKETLQSYLEKRRAPKISDIARAETVGKPEERQKDIERANLTRIGRARAKRKLQQIDRAENPQELVQQHHDIHHPYASRIPGVPDKPGSVYWGDHVEHDQDIDQLFERLIFLNADPAQVAGAEEMEKAGKPKEEIWKKVGAFREPNTGKWTQEISDDQLKIRNFKQQGALSDLGVGAKKQSGQFKPAAAVLKHDQLFKKVPQTAATDIAIRSLTPLQALSTSTRGQYRPGTGRSRDSIVVQSPTEKGALDTAVHELQHNVQRLQGRAKGASPAQFKKQGSGALMSTVKYYTDPGEIEARAAAARRTLTPAQRKERYPWKDYSLTNIFEDEQLNEMQLVGTDEYRQHAIAMTPGQDQEIEDVFPLEVYGMQINEPTEEVTNSESDGSVESGNTEPSPMSFRSIRKKLQEQEIEELEGEEEEIEGEEEELEDDGAEDGVDFTPTLKTKKAKNDGGPSQYARVDNSGLPILSTAIYEGKKVAPKKVAPKPKPVVKSVAKPKPLLSRITKTAGRIGGAVTLAGAADKARSGDLRGAATDVGVEAGTNLIAKKAGKSLLKKIPLVGAGIGLASAAQRARSGDLLGAAGEATSGIASTLPGAGTAVSTGIDAALLARDISKKQKPKQKVAEAVEYHTENNISLIENIYRPGSEMFFEMLFEAKRLYAEGAYTPKDEYEQDLLESDIGEVAEYEGQSVLLDFPFEEELNEEKDPTRGKGIGKPFRSRGGGAVYVKNEKGNVIKVNFSQSGMKKRFNEPARVKSFVARHNCYGNKDKTSASYWACRWPRYFSDSGQQWW